MEDQHKQFLSQILTKIKPDISAQSRKQYILTMNQLIPESITTEAKLKKFLNKKNIQEFIKQIEGTDKSQSTKRGYAVVLQILVKHYIGEDSEQYKLLFDQTAKYHDYYRNVESKKPVSESKLKTLVSTDDYEKMLNDLKPSIFDIIQSNTKDSNSVYEVTKYALLYIYFYNGLRNDLVSTEFYIDKKAPPEDDKYYLWFPSPKGKIYIVLNKYKTVKSYGRNVIDLDEKDLKAFLYKYRDFMKQVSYPIAFPNNKLTQSITPNFFSKLFPQLFYKHLGNKELTITGNRHRIISSDVDIQEYRQLKQKIDEKAKEMMHSVDMQQNIYFKEQLKNK
jgi:hypothetical protein